MNRKINNNIHQINYLTSEMNALYHHASLKLGVTDSISIVLYNIYDAGEETCLLSDIYKKTGINKQTVNTAIRSLEKDGILYLEQYTGRSKKVVLTEKGKIYAEETVGKLYQAEVNAFGSWTEDEINTYIQLMEKYAECLREQVEKL